MHLTSALKGNKLLVLGFGRFIPVWNISFSQNRKMDWSQCLSGRRRQLVSSLLVPGIEGKYFSHVSCFLVNIPTGILLQIYFYMLTTEIMCKCTECLVWFIAWFALLGSVTILCASSNTAKVSLTPGNRILSEKLLVPQLVKKSRLFHWPRMFITVYTTACSFFPL